MKTAKTIVVATALACAGAFAETERIRLDKGWKFRLDGESEFREVTVPHDWSVEYAPYAEAPSSSGGGFYRCGKGEYVLEGVAGEKDIAGNISLYFEGVYRDATVYLNGEQIARSPSYGYLWFRVDLTGRLRAGRNVLRVEVDNSKQSNCRWYSGSGIFRNVWFERRGTEYVVPDTAFVRCENVSEERADVIVTGIVTNTLEKTSREETMRFAVEKPQLWSPENPHLYTVDFHGEKLRYGIRKVEWSKDGFMLNGKPVILHGACVHHDHGPLGAASHDEAEIRKVRQLKAGGFNAVRTSHNPVSSAFLDACDEEGILVMDDMFDGWKAEKNPFDYGSTFADEWEFYLRTIIARDRNHPSIVMWSIGNEVMERTSPWAAEQAGKMAAVCHEMVPGMPVTSALCSWGGTPEWQAQDNLASKLDIVGYNYMDSEVATDRERFPDRCMVMTETYPIRLVEMWRLCRDNPFMFGEFVWTGIDYLGEATIGRWGYEGVEEIGDHWVGKRFPWHGGYCGDIDITGWRKPISHLRETLWNENAPTYLAVREPDGWKGKLNLSLWAPYIAWESWTFHGWEGKPIVADVYTRKPSVRLVLNGRTVEEKRVDESTAWTAQFTLPYEPGELKAEALDEAGNVVETCVLKTAGAMASIRYTSERIGDLEWVVAEVVDKDGTLCPDAEVYVTFEGDVIATVSANMLDNEVATSKVRRTWHGRAMAVVRK
ncbi:MAG: DUF4982 domain-containing protein [Kiritimatiellae bacterium]|nr:DUF4982 domain-containing protein [Kiritimatiellia bacterium]